MGKDVVPGFSQIALHTFPVELQTLIEGFSSEQYCVY